MGIRELRNVKLAGKTMNYPEHDQPKNEWYMTTVPSKVDENEKKFKAAWIIIKCVGFSNHHDFRGVRLDEPNFAEQWHAVITEAKEIVDALNSQPSDKTMCAECGGPTMPGDYLCKEHRN